MPRTGHVRSSAIRSYRCAAAVPMGNAARIAIGAASRSSVR